MYRAFAQRQYIPPLQQASPVTPSATSGAPATLDGAIAGLLPHAGKPLALSTTAFARREGEGAVVSINVDTAAFAGDAPAPLDITVSVVDQTGRQIGSARQTSTLGVRPPGPARAAPVDVQTHIELDSGDYEVRVAVADQKTGSAASVFSQIAIPKFAAAPLSVSDIAIEVGPAGNSPAGSGALVSILPTTQRRFNRGDQVRAFLQMYQGTERTDAIVPVSLRVRILDARGGATRDQSLVFSEKEFRARRADCQVNLPLDGLAAGEYLLEMTAAAGDEVAARKVRFAVQ